MCNNPILIANGFMEYFANLNNTEHDTFDTDKEQHASSHYEDIITNCNSNSGDLPGGKIECIEVRDITKSLKRKKAEGYDTFNTGR